MNKRIKFLRKSLKLNQTEFGKRVGVSDSTVGGWERGDDPIPDGRVGIICKEFGVRREWLATGAGEMFEPKEKEPEPSFVAAMMAMYNALPPMFQKLWDGLIDEILKAKGDARLAAQNVTAFIQGNNNSQNITLHGDILEQHKKTDDKK